MITIFTLAIDPFTQQLIHYYDCSIPINGLQATVPRTNFYLSHGIHTGAGEESITPALQVAINAGILSPGGLVSPDCLTGNCTFHQEYSTVGYCSNCTDVSDQLNFNTTTRNGTANSFLYGSDGGVNITTSLPSGLSITHVSSKQQNNLTTMGLSYSPLRVEFIVGKQGAVVDIVTGQPPTGCETETTNKTWRCQGYGAASCSLIPCVSTYTSAITAGEFQETSLPEDNSISWGSGLGGEVEGTPPLLGMVDITCLSAQERQGLSEAGYQVNSSTRWLPYNITFNPQPNTTSSALFPESMLAHECVYAIDMVITGSLWSDYLGTFFEGTVIGDGVDGLSTSLAGPQNLQTIYNYGNVSFAQVNSTFSNISDSISNYLRQNGNANHSAPARGLVMHDETCLHVRWSWVAFPATFVLFTLIFLVVTIIDTRPTGSRVQIWKSSPLALIFHGLEMSNTHLKDQKDVSEIGNMEDFARDIVVRLDPTENGVKLVEVEREHL
ncbi:hypothetical protein MMC28_011532 [Mycoblastus sanguinarius]|nr:hypothetical protein [Mycoblastus sanguinarius]